jgi:hypothetical protein
MTGSAISKGIAARLIAGGAAVQAAEAAVKDMAAEFAQWLAQDVVKLDAAYARIKAEGLTAETLGQLYMRAHDLKSLGGTCDYPIVTRLANTLCELIDDEERPVELQMGLVGDHIDAIRVVVAKGVRTEDEPLGRQLLEELERDIHYR